MLVIYNEFSFIQKEVFDPHYLQFNLVLIFVLILFYRAKIFWNWFIFHLKYWTYVLPAYVAVCILQVNLAQISLTSISFNMLPHLLHIVIIDISTQSDSTLKADTSMTTLHENGICWHITADQTLSWLILFFETSLLTFDDTVLLVHPTLFTDDKLRAV